jgi:diadenosine tetraphosphate (Ap4A) HIT family hydrolase
VTGECYPCTQTNRADIPDREAIWVVRGWRVAHDFNSSLPGWLIVVPTRHLEGLDELTDEEAATLGLVLRGASIALKAVTGCIKTYVMLFAEAEGFGHLHLHVVPRLVGLPDDRRGPAIFAYNDGNPVSEDARDDLALRLRAAWDPVGPIP